MSDGAQFAICVHWIAFGRKIDSHRHMTSEGDNDPPDLKLDVNSCMFVIMRRTHETIGQPLVGIV